MRANEIKGGPTTRYKMKIVEDVPATSLGSLDPIGVLAALEHFHEDEWDVVGLLQSDAGELAILYRKKQRNV